MNPLQHFLIIVGFVVETAGPYLYTVPSQIFTMSIVEPYSVAFDEGEALIISPDMTQWSLITVERSGRPNEIRFASKEECEEVAYLTLHAGQTPAKVAEIELLREQARAEGPSSLLSVSEWSYVSPEDVQWAKCRPSVGN